VRADRGRLAQALGNLVANAVEHGSGPVELRGGRTGENVRVEVRDGSAAAPRRGVGDRRDRTEALDPGGDGGSLAPLGQGRRGDRAVDRGRGLAIARRAVEDAGGSLVLERGEDGTTAAIELPVAEP
jgi:signal transduction histidine kinase